jgi:hypothetical protein
MKTISASLLAVVFVVVLHCPAFAASDRIQDAVDDLDNNVKSVDIQVIVGDLAKIGKFDRAFVEKSLTEKKYKYSELIFIKMLADNACLSPEVVMESNPDRNWLPALKRAGYEEKDILQHLENTNSELAFALLDVPDKKRGTKRLIITGHR